MKNMDSIAAVEAELGLAGCSHNPDHNKHQGDVATAVAVGNCKLVDHGVLSQVFWRLAACVSCVECSWWWCWGLL
jgi:hypothetical protein